MLKGRFIMNEKLQYATMLEIPVNTCNITYKPTKKKKIKNKKKLSQEDIKEKLLEKVNNQTLLEQNDNSMFESENGCQSSTMFEKEVDNQNNFSEEQGFVEQENAENLQSVTITKQEKKHNKEKRKMSIIGVQLMIIGALVAIIFLTNSFYAESGINVFLRNIFSTPSVETEIKLHNEFSPVLALGGAGEYQISDGIISCNTTGSIYAPCDGTISMIEKDDNGKFNIEISHSEQFKTVISGLDYAYQEIGGMVFGNIPVGYVKEQQISLCFRDGEGNALTNFELNGNAVLWAV